MKKIFILAVIIGTFMLVFQFFYAAEKTSGADKSQSSGIEEQNGIEQVGPPWYDPAWNYRKPVIITNNGEFSGYYQVLIKLNNSNFDFTRAKPDGSDMRITGVDGTTELKYWIESWNSTAPQAAFIWVRLFPLMIGTNTIYLYYNNNSPVVSLSDGTKTFDGFDDQWSQFAGGALNWSEKTQTPSALDEINSTFTWIIFSGTPTASGGILSLPPGSGIKSNASYLFHAVGFRANFGLGSGGQWGGFINEIAGPQSIIADRLHDVTFVDMYLINSTGGSAITTPLNGDWHNAFHTYEIRWRSGWSDGNIDHGVSTGSSTSEVPTTSLPVTLYSSPGSNSTLIVDWVYERLYQDPEPTANLGTEQGLVDLGIDMVDSPDPLPKNTLFNYLITISNDSNADAAGVVITDTLPTGVVFVKSGSSSVCNQDGNNIICSVISIGANSTTSVTISAYPTEDGIITNTAYVGSLGFETNPSNNTAQAVTLVDSIKPVVVWEQPVGNRQTYVTDGGEITLEVSATDNDQISRVEFKWFDGKNNKWNLIDTAYSPTPANSSKYQVTFSSNILTPNLDNPVEVYAFDRAGNENSLEPPDRQVIFIHRIAIYRYYLPITTK
jgi:uncharacterized repeat protein (TIGR01451 family)